MPTTPPPRGQSDDTDLEALGRAVKQLQWRHHRTMEQRLNAAGSTLAQWDALRAIDRNPGVPAHTLAQYTFQSDQSFGALATRMQKLGLIERVSGKGRAIEHRLTDAGRSTLTEGHELAATVLAESFAPLQDADRATLLRLLTRVIHQP